MAEKKQKRTRKKTEAKISVVAPVTQFRIPARTIWGVSPLEIAGSAADIAKLPKHDIATHFDAVFIGDFVVLRNENCEETFVLHKSVLKELAELMSE